VLILHSCSFAEDPEASSSDDIKSRLKKKAVSGLQRKDSQYTILLAIGLTKSKGFHLGQIISELA
jgi:hypothetical protein